MTSVANLIVNTGLVEPLKQDYDLIGKSITVDTIDTNNINVTGEYSINNVPVMQLDPVIGNHNFLTGGNNADLQTGGVTGTNNTSIGYSSINSVTTGSNNTAVGNEALNNLTGGSRNTAIGNTAGDSCLTGSDNIFIGHDANTVQGDGNYRAVIGAVNASTDNSLYLDSGYLSSVAGQTTDATNGRLLAYNSSTKLVSSATEIKFPYVTTSPSYNDVSAVTVNPNGTSNARSGIVNIEVSDSLGGNNSVDLVINNSSVGSGSRLMFAVVTKIVESNSYYKLLLYKSVAAAGTMTFSIQNLTSDATATNWAISIYFYILN